MRQRDTFPSDPSAVTPAENMDPPATIATMVVLGMLIIAWAVLVAYVVLHFLVKYW